MVKFIVIRHGEATHNVGAEVEGDSAYENPAYRDASLTAKGVNQTSAAGKAIAAEYPKVAAIWSSPLRRCLQTAENVMESVGYPADSLYVHDSLLERLGRGHICNTRALTKDIRGAFPDFKTEFLPDSGPEWNGPEPHQSVMLRMTMLIEHLKRVYAGAEHPVLIVSHHDAIFEVLGRSLKNAEFVVTDFA